MADVETPAADPSPAAPPAPSPEADTPVSVPTDPEAYAEWRQSGKLPDPKPSKTDDSAPSKKSADQKSEKGAPVSETGSKRQERGNAETRKQELNNEIRELLAKRDELRREVEPEAAPRKKDVEAASSPARDGKAASSPAELQGPVEPEQDDFDTWDAYKAALRKYQKDLVDWTVSQHLEQHAIRQQQEAQAREMQQRLDRAKERYGTEAEPKIIDTARTVFDDTGVAPALKTAMGRSDVLVDALYVMGSDPDELSEYLDLARKDPLEALRKWFTVEALVKEELAKGSAAKPSDGPPRGPDGKFLQPAKVKVVAPAPPVELNGSASPPGDERERAAAAGNFRSFKTEADRRDMQRMRGN